MKNFLLNLRDSFRRSKIRDKVFLLVLMATFLSTTIFFTISYFIYLNSVKTKAQSYSYYMISQMIKNTDSYFKGIESIALSLAYNHYIQKIADSNAENKDFYSYQDAEYIDNALKLFVYSRSNLQIAVFMENDVSSFFTLYTSINQNPNYNFKEDKWYQEAKKSKEPMIILLDNPQNYYADKDRKPVYTMVYKIHSSFTQDVIGYVLMDIDKIQFEDFFKNEYLDIAHTIILDENGNTVYSYPEDPSFKIAQYLPKDQKWGYFSKTINSNEYMVIFGTSEYTKWKIVNILPYKSILKDVDNLKTLFILLSLSLLVVTLIISYRFSARITNPLVQLSRGMEKIKNGEFQFTVPATSDDEIGALVQDFNSMTNQIDYLMKKNETIELIRKETELQALQQQINPHFLYNTLEIVIGLSSENESKKVIAICKNLGSMFRYNLNSQRVVYIRDELNHVRSYTQILEYRFEGKFKAEYNINPDVYEYKTVKFILQPFVENAISHGFKNITRDGLLSLNVDWHEERIRFTISDNGSGIDEDILDTIHSTLLHYGENSIEKADIPQHLGIINVFMRLKLLFQERFRFSIESEAGRGTTVIIEIPPIT